MEIKISTKEKFNVIKPIVPQITVKLAEDINIACINCLNSEIKNIILNLEAVTNMDEEAAKNLAQLQQQFYENSNSFVMCELKPQVEDIFEKFGLLDLLNVTPTESEAWDIVQMEEIERELFDEEELE